MPRLSVDIDLTYIPIEDRATTRANVSMALSRIKGHIERAVPDVRVMHRQDIAKLHIATPNAEIKLEVNLVGRGVLSPPIEMILCDEAQNSFDVFCAIPVVPLGQLYGGKICAALDRQHPRDLFDVKYLLANEGFSHEVKQGFMLALLGSERPLREIIQPNLQDQRSALDNQFSGMTREPFTYEEYEAVRVQLITLMRQSLTPQDKAFLLSVKGLAPDWSLYNYAGFPSVAWKLQNLQRLKEKNPAKFHQLYEALAEVLHQI